MAWAASFTSSAIRPISTLPKLGRFGSFQTPRIASGYRCATACHMRVQEASPARPHVHWIAGRSGPGQSDEPKTVRIGRMLTLRKSAITRSAVDQSNSPSAGSRSCQEKLTRAICVFECSTARGTASSREASSL